MAATARRSSSRYRPLPGFANEPSRLSGMRLRDGRAGTDDLPALAPGVAGRTHLTQAKLWCRQLQGFWQGTLAGGLARAIDVEDDSLSACSINKSACLPLFTQRRESPSSRKSARKAS